MINVTKTFLPSFEEYTATLKRAWDNAWITNNGVLVQELETRLKSYLGLQNLLFCNNGTIVLQMALKALNITGEVITTPFSYVATTTALLWEGCKPVFVDIDENTFCIDPDKIEAAITPDTQAILATHVYGYPCDVEAIRIIAERHGLKVIYDAAHAFGTTCKGLSIFGYGDVSTCSFHATKVFHSGEGGAVLAKDREVLNKLLLFRQFGHIGDDYFSMGINGKNSEFHAALGLCNLNYIEQILEGRKKQWLYYNALLQGSELRLLDIAEPGYNYAYFPVVFPSEAALLAAVQGLNKKSINPRRYFYPSLNVLPYVNGNSCPVSESVAPRVLCLPLFHDMTTDTQETIAQVLLEMEFSRI